MGCRWVIVYKIILTYFGFMNKVSARLIAFSCVLFFGFNVSYSLVFAQDVRQNENRTVQVMNLSEDTDKGLVIYAVDNHVRSASYRYYNFDRDSFLQFFDEGKLPTEPFEAEIRFHDNGELRPQEPVDPGMSAPQGGFRLYDYQAELVSVNGERAAQKSGEIVMPEYGASPLYHEISLDTDFMPDPHVLELEAGGGRTVGMKGCEGYVNFAAPDANLTYTNGLGYPLSFYAQSNDDVTLLIRTPNGDWFCESNTGRMENALVIFNSPPPGTYHIWVGLRHQAETYPEATVSISEKPFPDDVPALRIPSGGHEEIIEHDHHTSRDAESGGTNDTAGDGDSDGANDDTVRDDQGYQGDDSPLDAVIGVGVADHTFTEQEIELYDMIMEYRASLGLPAIPLSRSLS